MYRLLIVDDEPLVQVGIKSMLNWAELNIEICGTCVNGKAALELMETELPDIVLTDIKMPVMDGLELIKTCREHFGEHRPHFVILTSYEEFSLAKEALRYHASDYLVKLELTQDTLKESMYKVIAEIESEQVEDSSSSVSNHVHGYMDKFLISLLHNLFESEEQFTLQAKDLSFDVNRAHYLCIYGEILSDKADSLSKDAQLSLFQSAFRMLEELLTKSISCNMLSLDIRHFALLIYPEADSKDFIMELPKLLTKISASLKNYYSVTIQAGIGLIVSNPLSLCDSFQQARLAFMKADSNTPFLCIDTEEPSQASSSFNMSLFKKDLTKAFEEYDADLLSDSIMSITDLLFAHSGHFAQALDAASNILYLSISLLQDGENIVSCFFNDNPEGYRSLYHLTNVEQICNWLKFFSDNMCQIFSERRMDYKNRLVSDVKKYLECHITEKLSLNEVAAVFGISPSYLSQLFGKYNDTGFSEFINNTKIAEAKRMLIEESKKIYEVADDLGFESAFYFSKVFKRVEGISPSDFINKKGRSIV